MTTTLYQRLGGAEGIARLVDDAVAAHLANPLIKNRFEQIKDLAHVKQLSREFLTRAQGVRPTTPARACAPRTRA